MTAPVFFVPVGSLAGLRPGDPVTLTGEEARHAAQVQRVRPGERIDVADGAGQRGSGPVSLVDKATVVVTLDRLEAEPPALPFITLVQALAKNRRDEAAIEAATELGVDAIVPWQADRSVVQWRGPEKADKGRARWQEVVKAAAKVARRACLPEVMAPLTTSGLLQYLTEGHDIAVIVLHEAATEPFEAALRDAAGHATIALVVGPEGGITDQELAAFRVQGAGVVRLGPTVLRSSTAGPAALAVLSQRLGRWDVPRGSDGAGG
ncbi:MAG: 16S rRNA (uracil(1498)-N(3))-methyltransferase [Bifidobacteriaceae bacterium]|jgi:16S rRNA (uracil1498-N3)-methyltransferase|nr:16S rRNA (uracil(1498)-N(3))-methyltransferase [Bifidobacteriaceae bacterium]